VFERVYPEVVGSKPDNQDMGQYIRVCDLAGELNISIAEVVRVAKSLGINVNRGVANLHSGQAFKIREAVASGMIHRSAIREALLAAPPSPPPRPEFLDAKCSCCQYAFRYKVDVESDEMCAACAQHFQQDGESFVQTHVRLEDHEAMSRKKVEQYREACDRLSREKDEAYAKRNKWMAALVEIVIAHAAAEDDDGCLCGAPEWPCVTRRHLRIANVGIYKQAEKLESLPVAERDRILYDHDYSYFQNWDDGVA